MNVTKRNVSALVLLLFSNLLVAGPDPKPSLSLEDLGFKESDTRANPELQLQLEKRTSMLHTHQLLGLVTTLPMLATFLTGDSANKKTSDRDVHMALGLTTTALYMTTAGFAIFAPKPDGIVDKGNTRIHRWLSYIHGPLMILTPILGLIAKSQRDSGERVHGIASIHGAAATVLLISYIASEGILIFDF